MKKNTIILLVLFTIQMFSQENKNECSNHPVSAGVEIDALPYITGGFYGSAWVGYEKLRLRSIITKLYTPEFITPDGFSNLKTMSYTIIADYFPLAEPGEYKGLWIGLGYEFWKNDVENSNDKTIGKYNNSVFTIGGGYIFTIWKNLYLNPWIAGHFALNGTSDLQIGDKLYRPNKVLPEFSVKFGWQF